MWTLSPGVPIGCRSPLKEPLRGSFLHAETQLAYGGLKKETVERLRLLGKQYDGKPGEKPKGRSQRLPIAGTRLIREWQGAEHSVTVRGDDFEYQGRPYKSLSAIAREITGVRWNGWVFFGLKSHRGAA